MKIILRDYKGHPVEVSIDDDVEYIEGVIITGDMVMRSPFFCDTLNTRRLNFDDGPFRVSKANFEKMNNMTSSYDIQYLD